MKKVLLITFMALLMVGSTYAKHQTADEALVKALAQLQHGGSNAKGVNVSMPMLTNTETSSDGTALCYVYSTDGGFIIAGADDRADDVLFYTTNGNYSHAMQNPAFKDWMESCRLAMTWLSKQPESSAFSFSESKKTESVGIKESVAPILQNIEWAQSPIYNMCCPHDEGWASQAPAGCVIIAIGQIMKHYGYPEHGMGKHRNIFRADQEVDFSQSYYDWSNMLDRYSSATDKSSIEAKAVSKLTYDLGCAMDAMYAADGTSSSLSICTNALPTYFGYSKNIRYNLRDYFTDADWNSLLMTELNADRPMVMSAMGVTSDNGHAFVIDGYDTNGLYHVNWGWGGMDNGYADINFMHTSIRGNYNCYQVLITGIEPDHDGTSVGSPQMALLGRLHIGNDSIYVGTANYSSTPFTGKISLMMYNGNGDYVARMDSDYSQNPFTFQDRQRIITGAKLPYKWPIKGFGVTPQDGYYIKAVYSMDGTTDTDFQYPIYWDGKNYFADGVFFIDIDGLEVSVQPVSAIKGSKPRLKVTLSLDKSAKRDFNYLMMLNLNQDGKTFSKNFIQPYLSPGQDSTFVLRCEGYGDQDSDATGNMRLLYADDLQAGNCEVQILDYPFYSPHSVLYSGNIDIQNSDEPPVLKFSNFNIDKRLYSVGEKITGSMIVNNTGGYTERDALFLVLNDSVLSNDNIAQLDKQTCFLDGHNTSTEVRFATKTPTVPGTYYVIFYCAAEGGKLYPTTYLSTAAVTVTDVTGVTDVTANAASDQDIMYDLMGRRIKSVCPGQLVICGGRKFVVPK